MTGKKVWLIPIGILMVGCLHTLIFTTFQLPGNFLFDLHGPELAVYARMLFYFCAVATSLCHQAICRAIGLRKSLQIGLFLNTIGLLILLFHHQMSGPLSTVLLWINMVLLGVSLTSVINALVTYTILRFPNKTTPAITLLFATFNGGVLLAPIMLNLFQRHSSETYAYLLLIFGMLLSMGYVHFLFTDPLFPKHLSHLRKGTFIWKELHYRLALFLIAIILYSLVETTFSLIGHEQIASLFNPLVANDTISFLWLFMIIGQALLLLPLYFYPAVRIFYGLVVLVVIAAILFPLQQHLTGLSACLILAGFGCSAMFPILLSMMEKEFLCLVEPAHLLPYIETGVSLMVAGYFLGIGLIDLSSELKISLSFSDYFHLAALWIFCSGLAALYLNLTLPKVRPNARL
jgi:hypothetical protein